MDMNTGIGLWFVGFVTTTGTHHEVAVHAADDDAALGVAFDIWAGEPIARFEYATLVTAAML